MGVTVGRKIALAVPKRIRELSTLEVSKIRKPGSTAVGGVPGLELYISPAGTRSWVLRVRMNGKRREFGLGSATDTLNLAAARKRARALREQIEAGVDPVEERTRARDNARRASAVPTFKELAVLAHQHVEETTTNSKYAAQWLSQLKTYIFPTLGSKKVSEITHHEVAAALKPIWTEQHPTARKLLQRIEKIFTHAIAADYRTSGNPAAGSLIKTLLPVLPRKKRLPKHFKAVHFSAMYQFTQELRALQAMENGRGRGATLALEFLVLTAARSGEVRNARWREVDLKAQCWTIPGERTKTGRSHRVPLTARAQEILMIKLDRQQSHDDYLFPGRPSGKNKASLPLSDATLRQVMRRMNVDAVPHGFRSTFKDWSMVCTDGNEVASELALNHVSDDKTRAAYARDELFLKRIELMRLWQQHCETPYTGKDAVALR